MLCLSLSRRSEDSVVYFEKGNRSELRDISIGWSRGLLFLITWVLLSAPGLSQNVTFETYPKDATVNIGSGAPDGYTPLGPANQPINLSSHYERSVLKLVVTAEGRKPWSKTFTSGELQEGTFGERIYLHPTNPLIYVVDFPLAFPGFFITTFSVILGFGFYYYREESAKRRARRAEAELLALGKEYEKDYGDYTLIKDLGQGAMGLVRLALKKGSRSASDLVAIKTILLSKSQVDDHTESDESDIVRIRREAKILQDANHPNIVRVYEWGERGGEYFIVMELLKGQDLKEYLKQNAPLPLTEVRGIFSQITSALNYLHERSVFHRDLKPANIHRLESGHIKLLDFGLATSSDQSRAVTQEGTILGTPDYMAPEHYYGRKQDEFYDQFSVGVIIFETLTGRLPVDEARLNAPFHELFVLYTSPRRPLRDFRPDLSPELGNVIDRMLDVEPENRFPTIRAAFEAFDEAYVAFQKTGKA